MDPVRIRVRVGLDGLWGQGQSAGGDTFGCGAREGQARLTRLLVREDVPALGDERVPRLHHVLPHDHVAWLKLGSGFQGIGYRVRVRVRDKVQGCD